MDLFLTACGACGPLLLEVEGPGLPSVGRLSFSRPYVLIGRDDRADLVFDHDAVSRRHVYLQVVEGGIFVVDLDSRTGTAVEGASVESAWLEAGQTLAVGPYTLRPTPAGEAGGWAPPPTEPPRGNPMLARSGESSDLPGVSLEFQSRTSGHSVWRMSPILALVGSSSRCKVRLLDSQVSKLHCALLRTGKGLWVVDLLGRGGISVNGATVRSKQLQPGDVLGLGQVVVRPNFEEGPDADGGAFPIPWTGMSREPDSLPRRQPAGAWGYPQAPARVPPPVFQPPTPFPAEHGAGVPGLNTNEPALGLLLNHFGQMQQQMLDQFQQTMMMMMQMFGGMHRDQMGLMREELDRLRELNHEMAAIKSELAARPGRAPGPGQAGWGTRTAPAAPIPPPPSQAGPPYYFGNSSRTNGRHSTASPDSSQGSAPARPPTHPEPAKPGPMPPIEPPADVHDWLNERLTAITTEQQNRWQRLMTMVRGGGH